MDYPVLINGNKMSAVDVKVNINGVPVFGISKIVANEEQEKKDHYSLGSQRPTGRSRGVIKTTGSITLSQEEIQAIRQGDTGKNMLNIAMFDISVVAQPKNSANLFVCILKNCEFIKSGVEMDIDSEAPNVEIPLIISHIEWK